MIYDVIVTGTGWVGRGVPSVESILRRLISGAQEEIQWTIYAASGGAGELLDLLEARLHVGVKVIVVINHLDTQPAAIRRRIAEFIAKYKHFVAYDFAPADAYAKLHAKVLIIDRRTAVVGSANVSRGGLVRNHEIGVIVRGKTAAQLGDVFDRLLASGPSVRRRSV